MAFTIASGSPTRAPRRTRRWGRVLAAGLNLVLWSLIAAAVWGALKAVP